MTSDKALCQEVGAVASSCSPDVTAVSAVRSVGGNASSSGSQRSTPNKPSLAIADPSLTLYCVPSCQHINVDQIHRNVDDKVSAVRSCQPDAPPPSFSTTSAEFSQFQSLTVDDAVVALSTRCRPRQSNMNSSIASCTVRYGTDFQSVGGVEAVGVACGATAAFIISSLFQRFQSTFHANHPTKTAVLKVRSHILLVTH